MDYTETCTLLGPTCQVGGRPVGGKTPSPIHEGAFTTHNNSNVKGKQKISILTLTKTFSESGSLLSSREDISINLLCKSCRSLSRYTFPEPLDSFPSVWMTSFTQSSVVRSDRDELLLLSRHPTWYLPRELIKSSCEKEDTSTEPSEALIILNSSRHFSVDIYT